MNRRVVAKFLGPTMAGLLVLTGCTNNGKQTKPAVQDVQQQIRQAGAGKETALPAGWTKVNPQGFKDTYLTNVQFHDGRFYLFGTNTSIFSSADGVNWTKHYANGRSHNNEVYDVQFTDKGIFLLTRDVDNGDQKLILYSKDGADWKVVDRPKSMGKHLAYGNGVLLTDNRRSFDGVTWEDWRPNVDGMLDYVFGNGMFIGYGPTSIALSLDGKKWTTTISEDLEHLIGVKFDQGSVDHMIHGNGRFVAYTTPADRDKEFPRIATSTDGKNWSASTPTFRTFNDLQFVNGRFLGITHEGKVVESQDGLQWKEIAHFAGAGTAFGQGYSSITEGNGMMLLVEPGGTIFIKKK